MGLLVPEPEDMLSAVCGVAEHGVRRAGLLVLRPNGGAARSGWEDRSGEISGGRGWWRAHLMHLPTAM